MKLKARIRVQALIRAYDLHNTPCLVVAKGDPDGGTILIKLNHMNGQAVVFTEARTLDGDPAWRYGTGQDPIAECDADAYIARQRSIDPDVWVIEVEDPTAITRMIEPILPIFYNFDCV